MNNENFDKKIKAKLDSLEPAFQEQDWQNFSPLLHPKKPFGWRFRKPFVFGIAFTTLFFLIYQNRQLSIENKELHHKVNDIVEKTNTVTPSNGQNDSDIKNIKGEKIIDNQLFREIKVVKEKTKEQTELNERKIEEVRKTSNLSWKQIKSKDKNTLNFTQSLSEKQATPYIINKAQKTSQNPQNTAKTLIAESEAIASNDQVIESSDNNAIQKKSRLTENINIIGYQWFIKTQTHKDAANPPEKVALTPKIIKPKPSFYRYGIGLNSTIREENIVGGFVVAYQITRHLQLNSGLQVLLGHENEFRDNIDFKKRFKSDFKDKFPKPFLKDTFFRDIHSKRAEFAIPLSLNYQVPIIKKISLFMELGTAMTVHSKEIFDYKFSNNGTNFKEAEQPLKVKANHKVFQNANVALGLQYQFKHYQIRLAPSYQFNFGQTKFESNDFEHNFGLKLQALYLIK